MITRLPWCEYPDIDDLLVRGASRIRDFRLHEPLHMSIYLEYSCPRMRRTGMNSNQVLIYVNYKCLENTRIAVVVYTLCGGLLTYVFDF